MKNIILAIVSIALVGCNNPAINRYNQGVENINIGNYSAAITAFDKAINEKKDLSDSFISCIYTKRGEAKSELMDYHGSLNDYSIAIRLNPKNFMAYNRRGTIKVRLKQYNDAIKDYDTALLINPQFALGYSNRGVAKVEINDYESGFNDFNRALDIDSNFDTVYHNRGLAKTKVKDYIGAIEDHKLYMKLDSDKNKDIACVDIAINFKYLHNIDSAFSYIDDAIRFNRENHNAFVGRASLKFDELQDYIGAIKDLSKAIELASKNSDYYFLRGVYQKYYAIQNHNYFFYKSALEDFDKTLELDNKNTSAYLEKGIIELILGQRDKACEDLSKAKELGIEKNIGDYPIKKDKKYLKSIYNAIKTKCE